MSTQARALIVGGTTGLGRGIAQALADRGEQVIITGRDLARTQQAAKEIGPGVEAIACDLAAPEHLAEQFAGVGPIDHLVLSALERDDNSVRNYDFRRALRLVTLKLVGYTEIVHLLSASFPREASVVLLGGQAKERPYPGSTTITTVNGGVSSMIRTLAVELAPVRFNAVHPGVVGDTAAWSGKPDEFMAPLLARTPTGRLATTADVAAVVLLLLDNGSVNGVNIPVDGGWLLK